MGKVVNMAQKAQIIVGSCSRRSLEIEQIRKFLQGNGYDLVDDDWRVDASADLILINTCGFTQAAEDAAFALLERCKQTKKTDAHLVLGGCVPEINPDRVSKGFDGLTYSPRSYDRLNMLPDIHQKFESFIRPNIFVTQSDSLANDLLKGIEILKTFDGSLTGLNYISQRLGNGVRRRLIRSKFAHLDQPDRFYIQLQEGCSMHCAYCAIRLAIGPLRSKSLDQVMTEFWSGLSNGYRNFQFVGDNSGSYGFDIGTNLGDLLEKIGEVDEEFTIDLTDIHPVYFSKYFEQIKSLCVTGKLTSLYVPIQSGSRRILKLMGRDCDIEQVKQQLSELKQHSSRKVKIGTSLVVGFPTEGMEELEATIQFCDTVKFDWVWCHSFSARLGTTAAELADQIPPDEIHRRVNYLKTKLGRKTIVTTADDTTGNKTCQG